MSYTLEDAMREEAYEAMSRELYPDHRDQAIAEFTSERLRSYYLHHPDVAINAVLTAKEANALLKNGHPSACVVFAVTSIEQFLKAALLKPVVFGLVHVESLAIIVMDIAMDQNGGLGRYKKLLAGLFTDLARIDVNTVRRQGAAKPLLEEIQELQSLRNSIVHRGHSTDEAQAKLAIEVLKGVFSLIFVELLSALGLEMKNDRHIVVAE